MTIWYTGYQIVRVCIVHRGKGEKMANLSTVVRDLQRVAKEFPGLSQADLIARLPAGKRFDAALYFDKVVEAKFLAEVDGKYYHPSPSGAAALLRHSA